MDSSVLFSALYSSRGFSRDLLLAAARGEMILVMSQDVAAKDAPIVAAAWKAKVDMLVTLDKKHLLGKPGLAKYVRADIITPGEAMTRLAKSS